MSMWESVGTTYIEAATSALPIQRLAVFSMAFIGALAAQNQTHLSIFETITRLPLWEMTSISSGLLGKATIAEVMIGVSVVFSGWFVTRTSLRAVFALAARSTDLWARIKEAQTKVDLDESQSLEERQKAIELIDSSLRDSKHRLRAMEAVTEFLSGLGMGALVAAHWGNMLDGAIGGVLLLVAVGLQFGSVRLFLTDYFGPALYKARLQGKAPPTPLRVR